MAICVFSTVNQIEAGLLKSALDEKGIVNFFFNYNTQSLGGIFAPFSVTNLLIGDIKVMVKEEDVEKALEVIKDIFGNDQGEQYDSGDEDSSNDEIPIEEEEQVIETQLDSEEAKNVSGFEKNAVSENVPSGTLNKGQTDFKRKRNNMLDFVRKAFRGGLEVILWINLFIFIIGGGVVGYSSGALINYRDAGGYAFGGVLIGLICGLLVNIVMGGFIATILNMDANLEKLLPKMGNGENNAVDNQAKKILQADEMIVTQDTNVRKGPGEDYLHLGIIYKDEIITVIKTENNWSCFIQDNGRAGWINSSFLTK
jgi:hypothetical protein